MKNLLLVLTVLVCASCPARVVPVSDNNVLVTRSAAESGIRVGAELMNDYVPMLEGRRVGVVTNHTGMVGGRHLVDTLLARGVQVELVFAPEHGFRGTAGAGEHVDDTRDAATGLEIVSLYGANRKPRPEQIGRCDVVLFDIQDVGCRFYTYLSTLHYVMEACAENDVPLIVLDRPNPNGMYVDGPVLDTVHHRSFVGMHPIPVVHGMTLGELACMINGKGWLAGGVKCDMLVVPCDGYRRSMRYELPVPPSPALPNMKAVYLYPSLCFFEATKISVGRGTDRPFQVLIYPDGTMIDLRTEPDDEVLAGGLDLSYLTASFYHEASAFGGAEAIDKFLSPFFEKLIGVSWVREMMAAGCSADEIEARWADDVERFKVLRNSYLIYADR